MFNYFISIEQKVSVWTEMYQLRKKIRYSQFRAGSNLNFSQSIKDTSEIRFLLKEKHLAF